MRVRDPMGLFGEKAEVLGGGPGKNAKAKRGKRRKGPMKD